MGRERKILSYPSKLGESMIKKNILAGEKACKHFQLPVHVYTYKVKSPIDGYQVEQMASVTCQLGFYTSVLTIGPDMPSPRGRDFAALRGRDMTPRVGSWSVPCSTFITPDLPSPRTVSPS